MNLYLEDLDIDYNSPVAAIIVRNVPHNYTDQALSDFMRTLGVTGYVGHDFDDSCYLDELLLPPNDGLGRITAVVNWPK